MTADNYSKAIEQLKERFGRDSLLVQIFVRDLLNLVIKNAVPGRSNTHLALLCDSLESKLRALESLGRTKEIYLFFRATGGILFTGKCSTCMGKKS
ncbi:uncharacterized protein TNCV_1739641 [Trichonephila clavipes]|nr:uncharacterized protein TNCV_1739641 [Trichonephila clavipes]